MLLHQTLKRDVGILLLPPPPLLRVFGFAGENHYLLHIVTRWKRDHNGIKIVRSGKYMLEVVAIKRSRQEKYWAIPEV